jgi:hypothetical protein
LKGDGSPAHRFYDKIKQNELETTPFSMEAVVMTRKSLGYVELEWNCKRCGTKNPGLQKTCTNCGAPMTGGEQFELPEEQKIIEDEAVIQAAKEGADIHCPYCGARNPAGSEACAQCGGDLKEGAVREAGQVLGAHRAGPAPEVDCPYCNAKISATAQRCPNCGGDLSPKPAKPAAAPKEQPKLPAWMIAVLAGLLVLCCGGLGVFALLNMQTEEVRARVEDVSWQRSIAILEERLVEQADWEARLPTGAQNISCQDRYRETSSFPAPNSTEVCGTPYTVDQGSGVGEVVQDCVYEVYDSYCQYQVNQWVVVEQAVTQDDTLQPYWPALSLQSGQREGDRTEKFLVTFTADGKRYTYEASDASEFSSFVPGSEWTLTVNSFGGVSRIAP